MEVGKLNSKYDIVEDFVTPGRDSFPGTDGRCNRYSKLSKREIYMVLLIAIVLVFSMLTIMQFHMAGRTNSNYESLKQQQISLTDVSTAVHDEKINQQKAHEVQEKILSDLSLVMAEQNEAQQNSLQDLEEKTKKMVDDLEYNTEKKIKKFFEEQEQRLEILKESLNEKEHIIQEKMKNFFTVQEWNLEKNKNKSTSENITAIKLRNAAAGPSRISSPLTYLIACILVVLFYG